MTSLRNRCQNYNYSHSLTQRGGYAHLCNIEQDGYDEILKLASINLCSNTVGQAVVELTCNPPKEGDASYSLFQTEYNKLFESLQRRANKVSTALNEIEGISCQHIDGAMYAFPNIVIPENAVTAAKGKGMAPDAFYCLELLENAGICCVPGSGFGQRDGTFHLRTTILPQENDIQQVVDRFSKFHREFTKKYQPEIPPFVGSMPEFSE